MARAGVDAEPGHQLDVVTVDQPEPALRINHTTIAMSMVSAMGAPMTSAEMGNRGTMA